MQDLEPDMEDLLRRASEAYPLRQGEDKWDEIASKILQKPSNLSKPKQGWLFKKYSAVLLMFLLLLGSLVVNQYEKQNNSTLQKTQRYSVQLTPSVINKNDKSQVVQESSIQEKNWPLKKNQSIIQKSTLILTRTTKTDYNKNTRIITNKIPGKTKFSKIENIFTPGGKYDKDKKINETEKNIVTRILLNPIAGKESFLNTSKLSLEQFNKLKQFIVLLLHKEKVNINTKFPKRGFYYGVVSGVDKTVIKDQNFKKAGFDFGVLAGYRLSSALSLESGLIFAKKLYWTTGKYFSMDEMHSTMPAGMEMIEVHGTCRILEVPLHLRYDLSIKNNHRLFVSTGSSSYIMTNENNQYHTALNGTDGKMNGTYKKDRRYLAATIDLGLGYERDIGKKSHIRFEPYFQLPIKGIGVGHLAMKSTGLRIGITRSAH